MATACSIVLAEHPEQSVCMWGRTPEFVREMCDSRENSRLLPGVRIPDSIKITNTIEEAVDGATMLVLAIPTKYLRKGLDDIRQALPADVPLVSVIKGIENDTFLRPSQIIAEVLGNDRVVVLGGPSHAEEIARRLPATLVAASAKTDLAERVQRVFTTDRFRVYTNSDVVGVELAGALKNVVAIAAGICDGLGYGDNAKSALLTRGLVEMTRFGTELGADAETFAGLAGMGDLITTCTSRHSRNRFVGEQLGRGQTLQQILDTMNAVVEGITTTRSVRGIAADRGIDMPITQQVGRVLFDGVSAEEATRELMMRPPRPE